MSADLLLKAARMAKPGIDWVTTNGVVQKNPLSVGILVPQYFDPHDPAKGDLAALQNALEDEKNGAWGFYKIGNEFIAEGDNVLIKAPTPGERAMKCVQAMSFGEMDEVNHD